MTLCVCVSVWVRSTSPVLKKNMYEWGIEWDEWEYIVKWTLSVFWHHKRLALRCLTQRIFNKKWDFFQSYSIFFFSTNSVFFIIYVMFILQKSQWIFENGPWSAVRRKLVAMLTTLTSIFQKQFRISVVNIASYPWPAYNFCTLEHWRSRKNPQ